MTSRIKRLKMTSALISAVLAGGLLGSDAWAHVPSNPEAVGNVRALTASSNLVIHGKVTRVDYRMSEPGANGSQGIPYTFVTYSITKALRGTAPGSRITLRFVGGPDGRGGFVEVESVPKFKVGDEDVLFVAENGEEGCALVMCDFGRYRILDGGVYEGHGAPVVAVNGNRIVKGPGQGPAELDTFRYPAPSFDEMLKNTAFAAVVRGTGGSLAQARARYNAGAPQFIEIGVGSSSAAGPRASTPARGLAADAFLSAVEDAVAKAPRGVTKALRSAKVNAPLAVPTIVEAAPKRLRLGTSVSPGEEIRKD